MELIEAEPAVRIGRPTRLGGRLAVEEAKLARGVGVALFTPSATGCLGFADVGDFMPSGEVTEERVGAVPVVGEVGFAAAAVLDTGKVPEDLAPGAREALRAAAGVAVDGTGRVVDAGGGIEVFFAAVDGMTEELEVLRMVVAAVGGLEGIPDVVVAFVVAVAGAALAVPEPNVPEFRTCDSDDIDELYPILGPVMHTFFTSGVEGAVLLAPAAVFVDTVGLAVTVLALVGEAGVVVFLGDSSTAGARLAVGEAAGSAPNCSGCELSAASLPSAGSSDAMFACPSSIVASVWSDSSC